MIPVVIIFPDTDKMSDFIIDRNISNAEANSRETSLIAPLAEDDILVACTKYEGHLNTGLVPSRNFQDEIPG